MEQFFAICWLVALVVLLAGLLFRSRLERRRDLFLRNYRFPHGLHDKLKKTYPDLNAKHYHLVSQSLRQYFMAYRAAKYKFVGMPSRVADDLWHNFILYTKDYAEFCQNAFGRFFHHVPSSAYSEEQMDTGGSLRRTWIECCRLDGIDPFRASRLPLLFAIDEKLKVPGAVKYELTRPKNSSSGGTSTGDTSAIYYVDDFCQTDSGSAGDSGGSGDGCGGGCGGGD